LPARSFSRRGRWVWAKRSRRAGGPKPLEFGEVHGVHGSGHVRGAHGPGMVSGLQGRIEIEGAHQIDLGESFNPGMSPVTGAL